MNTTATKIKENGSAVPGVQTKGTTAAGIESDSEQIKPCPHRYSGCISQNGYMCTLGSACDPVNEQGLHFTISYTEVNGQRFISYNYGGKKGFPMNVPDEIIDADAALASTPFADTEPFDPAKFCQDVIGS